MQTIPHCLKKVRSLPVTESFAAGAWKKNISSIFQPTDCPNFPPTWTTNPYSVFVICGHLQSLAVTRLYPQVTAEVTTSDRREQVTATDRRSDRWWPQIVTDRKWPLKWPQTTAESKWPLVTAQVTASDCSEQVTASDRTTDRKWPPGASDRKWPIVGKSWRPLLTPKGLCSRFFHIGDRGGTDIKLDFKLYFSVPSVWSCKCPHYCFAVANFSPRLYVEAFSIHHVSRTSNLCQQCPVEAVFSDKSPQTSVAPGGQRGRS